MSSPRICAIDFCKAAPPRRCLAEQFKFGGVLFLSARPRVGGFISSSPCVKCLPGIMSLCSEVYGYGFAPFLCNLLFGIRAFGLVLGLLIMIKCLKKWKSGCCNHILKDVTATCFTQAGAKGLIWGHFSVSLLFPSDFLLVRIPLQSFDRQGEPSC